ncbi:hypothetical protein LARI1_G002510 [Lachnellula arida]|uniref:Uncharacterized protein n=1 Tax=Lachnellula arida TaxID=1316785 RepID=A0A8T9BH90_9HELO|nr:hypothetical protein LARI1_G002510 [Lachnellula arida]
MARKFNINAKASPPTPHLIPSTNFLPQQTLTAPIAAFTMATILFVYARLSIQAAKRNAHLHREADGGQISWHNESLRRHGKLDAPEEQGTVSQIVGAVRDKDVKWEGEGKDNGKAKVEGGGAGETENERILRERRRG